MKVKKYLIIFLHKLGVQSHWNFSTVREYYTL